MFSLSLKRLFKPPALPWHSSPADWTVCPLLALASLLGKIVAISHAADPPKGHSASLGIPLTTPQKTFLMFSLVFMIFFLIKQNISSMKALLERNVLDSQLDKRKLSPCAAGAAQSRRALSISSSQEAAVLRVVRAFKTRQHFCAGNMGVWSVINSCHGNTHLSAPYVIWKWI